MQLSEKTDIFLDFFIVCLKYTINFEHFEKIGLIA